jgi:hypothetical protein
MAILGDEFAGKMEEFLMLIQSTITQNEVLNIISSHAAQNISMKLTKSFRGLLLNQDVKVLAVNRYRAVFQIFDSNICAALEGRVHLHSQAFPKPVSARLIDQNVSKGMFALADFAYGNNDWIERKNERVRPKNPTYVSLQCRGESMRAALQTISIDGVGVIACRTIEPDTKVQTYSKIKLDFEITPNYRWESLEGLIVYMIKKHSSFTRCGISLNPNQKQAQLLERYVTLRKREIMEELNQVYLTATSPAGAERQYF